MLRELILKNIVLIEQASVSFTEGFTVLSGETGAGKTALITALDWVLGERIDGTKVRNPGQKALVQAAFDLPAHSPVFTLLEEAGISTESPLIIQREIQPSGKSRALAGGQLVSLQLLQQIAPYLVSLISQNSHQLLRSESAALELLDQFADALPLRAHFAEAWLKEKEARNELTHLESLKTHATLQLPILQAQLEELVNTELQDGEEEALFEEYQQLLQRRDQIEKAHQALQLLSEGEQAVLPLLNYLDKSLASLELPEPRNQAKEAYSLLQEVTTTLQRFHGLQEIDPGRLEQIDERLAQIDKLKKRYGKTITAILQHQHSLETQIQELETLDERLEKAEQVLKHASETTQTLASSLSNLRLEKAQLLASKLSQALRSLNIPEAEVEIHLEKASRTTTGEDHAIVYLRANPGEKAIAVHQSSSGGELARLFLALTVLLAEKNQPATMVFDEIDANVGGRTATLIGQQLKQLGRVRQVLCITHFPQVASQADTHIRILKETQEGRTLARIESLSSGEKEEELARMRG